MIWYMSYPALSTICTTCLPENIAVSALLFRKRMSTSISSLWTYIGREPERCRRLHHSGRVPTLSWHPATFSCKWIDVDDGMKWLDLLRYQERPSKDSLAIEALLSRSLASCQVKVVLLSLLYLFEVSQLRASAFSLSSSGGGSPRIHPMIPAKDTARPPRSIDVFRRGLERQRMSMGFSTS